jgi:hypothetical protein
MAGCIFCGNDSRLTNEHVWPKWLRPHLEHPAGPGTSTRTIIRTTGTETKSRPDQPATGTVKSVCEDCNNGWMSKLEAVAKPYLLALIEGKPRVVGANPRDVMATWIVKTALVAGSKFDPPAPRVFYNDLRATRRPGSTTRVWIGKVPYLQAHYIDWRPADFYNAADGPPEHKNGLAAVLSVGHLAMYVVGWTDLKPNLTPVFTRFGSTLVRIWPTDEPASRWPPHVTLGFPEGLDALADALMGSAPVEDVDPGQDMD